MRSRTISIIIIISLLVLTNSKADTEQGDIALQIYFPREITIEGNSPNLGQVGIIRGNESFVAKASKITLGRISMPGQKIIVDRSMVLSRLACNGIPISKVKLTGAEKITVRQQHQVIKSEEFVKAALLFLKENPPDASVCQWNQIRTPKDFILSGIDNEIRLSPSFARNSTRNQAKIQVVVFSGDKEIAVSEVTFRLKYNCREAVAKVDIPKGAIISPENVKIERTISNHPNSANWTAPYGLVAKRRLLANTVIHSGMVGPVKPEVLLKRNQNVVIRIDRLGLLVTAIGRAMQNGWLGDYIKVQNMDSKRIILAKVGENGVVEPVF